MQDIPERKGLISTPSVVSPDLFIDKIVEIEKFEMLELCASGGE